MGNRGKTQPWPGRTMRTPERLRHDLSLLAGFSGGAPTHIDTPARGLPTKWGAGDRRPRAAASPNRPGVRWVAYSPIPKPWPGRMTNPLEGLLPHLSLTLQTFMWSLDFEWVLRGDSRRPRTPPPTGFRQNGVPGTGAPELQDPRIPRFPNLGPEGPAGR